MALPTWITASRYVKRKRYRVYSRFLLAFGNHIQHAMTTGRAGWHQVLQVDSTMQFLLGAIAVVLDLTECLESHKVLGIPSRFEDHLSS